jgi:hypothetical protein
MPSPEARHHHKSSHMTSSLLCLREGGRGWLDDILKTQLPLTVWSGPWPCVPTATGRSDGACRRRVVMHTTTRRRHLDGNATSSMQAPSAHANAPDRVHMGDRPRHVQAASGRNTSRGARKEALGRLPMRNGSRPGKVHPCESANACIYNIRHTAPGDERPLFPATFCGKV